MFALRWRDVDDSTRCLTVTRKRYTRDVWNAQDGGRQDSDGFPLSDTAWQLLEQWKPHAKRASEPDALVFATWSGQADLAEQHPAAMRIVPGLRSAPAAAAGHVADVSPDLLIDGRTIRARPGKVVAELMGHTEKCGDNAQR